MRILIATSYRAVVGGVETYLRELLPALVARGHELALLYEEETSPQAAGIDEFLPELLCWSLDDPDALTQASAWRPDLCYLQGLHAPAVEESLLARFPVVLFAHNYHGTCVSGTKRHAWPQPCPCDRQRGISCLLNYYPRRCGGLNPRTLLQKYQVQSHHAALLSRYAAVLVASRHMQREYSRHGVRAERLHLTPLFPPSEVPDPQPPAVRAPTHRVLMIGRLTNLKGGTLLVEATRSASAILGYALTLVVAGDGPELPRLQTLAQRLGVAVEFHGWVGPDQRRALMRDADVLAVPSVWPEPFGLVGLEAGCVGLPAVAFAVGGIPDWLRPGETGELAPADPPQVQGLAQALQRALADPEHLSELRRGAWRMAASFTREQHVRNLEAILTQVAAIAPRPLAVGSD
jgi:glycosyltransferase involved in cell wall biosynthesis